LLNLGEADEFVPIRLVGINAVTAVKLLKGRHPLSVTPGVVVIAIEEITPITPSMLIRASLTVALIDPPRHGTTSIELSAA